MLRTVQLLRHDVYCPVLLRLKSEQLITNQIREFCYSYDDDNNNNNNTGNNNDNVTIKVC